MKILFVSTCALATIFAGTALADSALRSIVPGPGLYKDENGYSPAFPTDRWQMSRPVITGQQTIITTTRQRALVPESAGELQSRPSEDRVILYEPRGGYYMEGSHDMLR